MKRLRWIAALAPAAFAVPALAADHLDSPSVSEDAATDITDLYAFVSPNDPAKVVLIMDVFPLAGPAAKFSDAANYTFHIVRQADGADRSINCTFTGNEFACTGPEGSGVMAAGTVGQTASGDSITAFTGLKDDPFFFDLGAFQRTIGANMEANGFCLLDPAAGGNGDFFSGLNVLSIVLEVRKDVFLQGNDNSILAIWASTSRKEG